MAKGVGRRKGTQSKGYFYRSGRGWYIRQAGKYVPLIGPDGERLCDQKVNKNLLREAAARQLVVQSEETGLAEKLPEIATVDAQVGEVCAAYIKHLKTLAAKTPDGKIGPRPQGTAKTYVDRGQTLFDFCYGLPGEFFCNGDLEARQKKGDPESKRIHDGFGHKLCSELTPKDMDAWLNAHTWKQSGWRTRAQAVKRAINFAVERKMITANPIRGFKLPKSSARVTYLTEAQERAMLAAASPAFAIAMKVCIRTGARFGCEFAALCARHVRDHGDRMEWVFKAEESKTKRQRTILVTDKEIMRLVRERMDNTDDLPLFRNEEGEPWTRQMLSQNFRRAKNRVEQQKVRLDKDACMYSCRHTYAKRTLEGYWSGKPASLKTLARLMGNSVQVCLDHYLQFSEADNEMLWSSA